jgi:hypothetical protein
MNQTVIQKIKWFWPWQDNLEETWLSEMSLRGLHLNQTHSMARYDFAKGKPDACTYRLDFQDSLKHKNTEEYLRIFSDAGWEHMGTKRGWQYFRKTVKPGDELEIFTDAESKIQKYNRYLSYLGVTYPAFLILFVAVRKDWPAWVTWISAVVLLLFSIYAVVFSVKISQRIKRLRML